MTKIFAAGMNQENNTFNVRPTTLKDFGAHMLFYGEDIRRHLADTRLEWGGMFQVAQRHGWDLVLSVAACAFPGGRASAETHSKLCSAILELLKDSLPVDGIFLTLHGSMATDGCDDPEGDLLRRVREIVGLDVPIAASLDLHANVSDAMVESADILTSFRTTPHIDMYETGQRAAELLNLVCTSDIRLGTVRAQRPMLLGLDLGRTVDLSGPMPRLLAKARQIENANAAIHDISLCAGFPYADTYYAGPSVLVVAERCCAAAARVAGELADEAWKTREELTITFCPIDEIVSSMKEAASSSTSSGPLIIADYSDGIGGGAYGEGTALLGAMLKAGLENSVYGMIRDPDAVQTAMLSGIGSMIDLSLGGKTDARFGGGPIKVQAKVLRLSDGVYVRKGPYATGSVGNLGASALLQVGCLLITVCTEPAQAEDREQFRIFGICPEEMAVIALKGINHFRADFEEMASQVLFVDTGGLCSPDVTRFTYQNVRRPIWPLDEI